MKGWITVTHILSTVFFGMFIGGLFVGNGMWAVGLVLLIIDIIVGISLQHAYEQSVYKEVSDFQKVYDAFGDAAEEIRKKYADQGITFDDDEDEDDGKWFDEIMENLEKDEPKQTNNSSVLTTTITSSDSNDPLCQSQFVDKQRALYLRLRSSGARIVNSLSSDEAGLFLSQLCGKMAHAPLPFALYGIFSITPEDLGDAQAVVYSFRYSPESYGKCVFIFLTRTKENKLRFFVVETSNYKFMLCEYSGGSHLNYGPVELKNVPTRIKEVLKN